MSKNRKLDKLTIETSRLRTRAKDAYTEALKEKLDKKINVTHRVAHFSFRGELQREGFASLEAATEAATDVARNGLEAVIYEKTTQGWREVDRCSPNSL